MKRYTIKLRSLLIASSIFAIVLTQPSLLRDQDCKANESFKTCGTACEPSCDNQSPSFCTLQCVVGCQCDAGFVRNANKECVKPEQCNVGSSVEASSSTSNPSFNCAANETFSTCHNACSENKCPVKNAPLVACILMCSQGCSCKSGFSRNTTGVCIAEEDCPPVTETNIIENPCNLVDCRSGMVCKVQNGAATCVQVRSFRRTCASTLCRNGFICEEQSNGAACVPSNIQYDAPKMSCMTVRCGTKGGCAMVRQTSCQSSSCEQPACVNSNPCAATTCEFGQTCVLKQVQCFVAPCDPIAECVNSGLNGTIFMAAISKSNGTASGCSSVTCPTGEACKESTVNCITTPCPMYVSCVPINGSSSSSVTNGCSVVKCEVGETCREEKLNCTQSPCPSRVVCISVVNATNSILKNATSTATPILNSTIPSCKTNETTTSCYNPCMEEKCGVNLNLMCKTYCAPGCTCQDQFFRNSTGSCIKKTDCPVVNATVTSNSTSTSITKTCGVNETLSTCYNKCSEAKCVNNGKTACTKHCSVGCGCKTGFLRAVDGNCYATKDCPAEQVCGLDEEYRCSTCDGTCQNPDPDCEKTGCKKGCRCALGFVRIKGKCVTFSKCPTHTHGNVTCQATETYTDCVPKCSLSCAGINVCDDDIDAKTCSPGCVCRGKYKIDSTGECVHNRHCYKTTECPANEEWVKCQDDEATCSTFLGLTTKVPTHDTCFSGCVCSKGFYRSSAGVCVTSDHC